MHCYHLISLTFVLIADRKIFAQESDFFFDVPLIGTENDNLFSAPAQDMFEKLDDGDWTLPMLPAESPLDFLVGNFDSCDNVQSFGRIRARSDDSCINDQPVPEESGPRLDLGEIFAPLRNIQTQEDLVNFICPSWAFQGILDIPVCSETGDLSATPIDTNSINDLISSQLSQFELFDVEFAYLRKLIPCHGVRREESTTNITLTASNSISDSIQLTKLSTRIRLVLLGFYSRSGMLIPA